MARNIPPIGDADAYAANNPFMAYNHIEITRIDKDESGDYRAEVRVVLRPESGHLADQGGLPCKVIVSCFMGSYQNYHVMVGDTLVKLAEHNPKNKRIYQVGEECRLVFDPEEVHVL